MANTKTHNGSAFLDLNAVTIVDPPYTPLIVLPSQTDATEGHTNFRMGMAGTFSRLGFAQTSATGTLQAFFRKNTANGNETIIGPASTPGWVEDITNTDAVAKDDIVDVFWDKVGTQPDLYGQHVVFDGGASGLVNLAAIDVGVGAFTGTIFSPLFATGASATEAECQHKVRAAGRVSYFQAVTHAAANPAVTFTVRINGGDGNSTITIPANTTGMSIDTTHTDNLANGDLVCIGSSALAAATFEFIIGACITQAGGTYDWCGSTLSAPVAAPATSRFIMAKGSANGFRSVTQPFPISYTNTGTGFKNARIQAVANTFTSDIIWQFRKNNGNANNAVTVTAGVTGWFEDTTHTDDFADGDAFDYTWSGGGSGNLTLRTFAITIDNGAITTPTIFSFGQVDTGFSRRLENIGY